MAESQVHEAGKAAIDALVADCIKLEARVRLLTEALDAERAYHSNNTGANAARRKRAMDALPKNWKRGVK